MVDVPSSPDPDRTRGGSTGAEPGPTYAVLPPHPALEPYVSAYWVQEDWRAAPPGGHPPTRLLPGGNHDLCLFYGDAFLGNDGSGWQADPWAQVSGQRSGPVDLLATGRTGVVLVRFEPSGTAAFFDDLDRWPEGGVELEALVAPARVRELLERTAAAAGSPEERVAPVEAFLLGRLGQRTVDGLMRRASELIWQCAGSRPIEAVAYELGMSRRHLARCFGRAIGITPKRFAAVARFQRALAEHRQGFSWSVIASRGGFTDQAHLVREVRRFTGLTPTRLQAEGELCRRFNGATPETRTPGPTGRGEDAFGPGRASRIDKTVYLRPPSVLGCTPS